MAYQIVLSEKTKKIIIQLSRLDNSSISFPECFKDAVSLEKEVLISWLSIKQQVKDKHRFFLESLYSSLLTDLYDSLPAKKMIKVKKKAGWYNTLIFILLAIAGTIFLGCEGFDGIASIFNITSLPTGAIFTVAFAFSILSIVMFYAIDLVEISRNLGINFKSSSKIIDTYLQEIEMIKALRKELTASFSKHNREELADDLALVEMLTIRYLALKEARQALKKSLGNPLLNLCKLITAIVVGVIFFSGGFFAGQTVAIAVAGLFLASVTPTFWPVIVASLVVGLAALCVYWFTQRPGVENIIGKCVGLDNDKIDTLCDDDAIKKEQNKLATLKEMLEVRLADLNKIFDYENAAGDFKTKKTSKNKAPKPSAFGDESEKTASENANEQKPHLTRSLSFNSFFKAAANASNDSSVEDLFSSVPNSF
jgi:hypothetical protein